MTLRILPTAIDAERFAIGAAFLDPECADRIAACPEGFFWDAKNSSLHRAISRVRQSGGTVDPITVLNASKGLGIENLESEIIAIAMEVVTSASFGDHLRLCQEAYHRRRVIKALGAAMESAYKVESSLQDVISEIESGVFSACETTEKQDETGRLLMPSEYVNLAFSEFREATQGTMAGVKTGVEAWDDLIALFRPGTLNVLAARPGVGKSMLALQAAKACDKWVAFFSMEMLAIEQVERMIASQIPEIDGEALRRKSTWVAKGDQIQKILHEIRNTKIMISDTSNQTVFSIAKQCRRKKKDGMLDLVVVDYLQLCQYDLKRGENRAQAIGQVSKGLKLLANELRVPVLAIASMSRENERRDDKRPMLSDLKESGEIESDAHSVTFLHRESDYKKNLDQEFQNIIELIVKKNRGGRKGTRLLQFDGAASTFRSLHEADKNRYIAAVRGNTGVNEPKIPSPKKYGSSGWEMA